MIDKKIDVHAAMAVIEQSIANTQNEVKAKREVATALVDLARRNRELSKRLANDAIEAEDIANCCTALAKTILGTKDLTSLIKPVKEEEVPLTKKGKPRKKNKDGSYRKAPTLTPEQREKQSQRTKKMNEQRWHGSDSGKNKDQNK